MVDLVEGIKNALLSGNIYTVRQAVEIYEKRLEEFGLSDDRVYNNKRIWMMKELEKQFDSSQMKRIQINLNAFCLMMTACSHIY